MMPLRFRQEAFPPPCIRAFSFETVFRSARSAEKDIKFLLEGPIEVSRQYIDATTNKTG